MKSFTRLPFVLFSHLALGLMALVLLPSPSIACDGGGGGGGGGDSVIDYTTRGTKPPKPGNTGGGRGFKPPRAIPLPPTDGQPTVIDLDIPIRVEPVDTTTNEPVDLVTINPGIGGHPGSGYTPAGNFVMVGYRDIVSIVYDKNMGWVGISDRWGFKVKLPMTPFITSLINNALSGRR